MSTAEDRRRGMIAQRREEATTAFRDAARLRRRAKMRAADSRAREGLVALRSAMDWAEDTAEFEVAHVALDTAGQEIRSTYGCHLQYADGSYSQRCPVALAHARIGMSAAMQIEEVRCSVCGLDHSSCTHIAGEEYDGVECVRQITKARLLHIAFVSRPRQADARIQSHSVSTEELQRSLGSDWQPGIPVNCDICLHPCDGLRELDMSIARDTSPSPTEMQASAQIAALAEDGSIVDV